MSDFSMCSKTLCPSKEKCLRFTAKRNSFRQVYTEFQLPPNQDKCDAFKCNAQDQNSNKTTQDGVDKR